jgi:hypothetical protein
MPFLRIKHRPNLNAWDKKDAQGIAADWFDIADPEQSLYEAGSSLEEVENAAAYSLTNPPKLESCFVLRILPSDLASADIKPNNRTPGGTGVVAVDFRHWDAPASRDQLTRLVSHILDRVTKGEDVLRWIGLRQQQTCWRRFCDTAPNLVIEEARRRCCWKLEGTKNPTKTPTGKLRCELLDCPPTIPCARLRLCAWLRYKDRCCKGVNGIPEDDWNKAEEELREIYLRQLIGFAPPPPGLIDT